MKVLVTGSHGYIGAVLCRLLIEEGVEIVGIDTGFYRDCSFSPLIDSFVCIRKDIREVTSQDLTGVNAVIHLAALSNDPMGALNPELTCEINYNASARIATLAKEAGVERFIFSSSCSIYGVSGTESIDETGTLNPITEYAKSKIATEQAVSKLADDSFSPIFLRNSTVYGVSPMLRLDLVVNNLAAWAHTTKKIRMMSDGTPWRPLIHVRDLASAFLATLRAPRSVVHNQIFNVGRRGENYQIKQLAEIMQSHIPGCRIEYTHEHGSDARTYRVDFSKFNSMLKDYFNPQWNVESGAKELIAAFQEHDLTSDDFQGGRYIRLHCLQGLLNKGVLDTSLFWKEE